MPKVHQVMSYDEYFQATVDGLKRHEFRQEVEGQPVFGIGDVLVLNEFCRVRKHYTGRKQVVRVTYVSPRNAPWVPKNHVFFTIQPVKTSWWKKFMGGEENI